PHLAADNLELIRDEDGNNLLHVAASQGHADCLQHLTSLMGEDGLNERNNQQLTPAGLGVKENFSRCWNISEPLDKPADVIPDTSNRPGNRVVSCFLCASVQEKVLLWLLQFMQEQAISLDEVDQNGNTAVHVAAQYGHLTCIQNQQGERPSQSAERQGHTTCARYLVVVETCMSLASQATLDSRGEVVSGSDLICAVMQAGCREDKPPETSTEADGSQQGRGDAFQITQMMLTAEGTPGDGHWLVRQAGVGPDSVLRQLLGKDASDGIGPRERLQPGASLSREGPGAPGGHRTGLLERRELKLARLKQIMQRSLSESDSESYPPDDGKNPGAPPSSTLRPDRPSHLPITEDEPVSNHLHHVMRKHLPASSSAERKLAFSLSGSKSVDSIGYNPSPTSSDPEATDNKTPETPADGHKAATSPKSALKSPSSRRKTSQNLKLRVTFDEQVHRSSNQEPEPSKGPQGKERTPTGSSESKRPFGTFRSIMETLSGNSNHSNNSSSNSGQAGSAVKQSTYQNSPGRKSDSKGGAGGGAKGKSKVSNV
ncbi:hypothetical protein GOODEAATRI_016250, partial [Goodea atripinnis]